MDPSSIVVELVKVVAPRLFDFLLRKDISIDNAEPKLSAHLNFVSRWSETVQFYGMTRQRDTDRDTIPLSLDAVPRKFRGASGKGRSLDEADLLSLDSNFLLLGSPGAGKTTTIQRIARKILTEEGDLGDSSSVPIVVRLRELERDSSLGEHLAAALGIPTEVKTVEIREEIPKLERHIPSFRRKRTDLRIENDILGRPKYYVRQISKIYVGSELLHVALAQALSAMQALLLLDGLDEVASYKRSSTYEEIAQISLNITTAKIIVSCRTGDYNQDLDGFEVLEISPLDDTQKRSIAEKWLPDAEPFLEALAAAPYRDLADRPLFLGQLLVIFENQQYLPEQPSSIYKKISVLLIEEWDYRRRIARVTNYSQLTPERKLDFLAHLSYELTYGRRAKIFSESDLIECYQKIRSAFRLPDGEAMMVARDIESHTGIIVESGNGGFEFSHLSLQEYLCAYYIVRASFSEHVESYLRAYPAPLAVAVAISSDPSNWLAQLLLSRSDLPATNAETILGFLARLHLERPYFTESISLGMALLKLCFTYGPQLDSRVISLLSDEAILKSMKMAAGYYTILIERRRDNQDYLVQTLDLRTVCRGHPSQGGYLSAALVRALRNP